MQAELQEQEEDNPTLPCNPYWSQATRNKLRSALPWAAPVLLWLHPVSYLKVQLLYFLVPNAHVAHVCWCKLPTHPHLLSRRSSCGCFCSSCSSRTSSELCTSCCRFSTWFSQTLAGGVRVAPAVLRVRKGSRGRGNDCGLRVYLPLVLEATPLPSQAARGAQRVLSL